MVDGGTSGLTRALGWLGEAYRSTLRSLTSALETGDLETHGHSERVVSFRLRLGRELGLGEDQLRSLEFGSLLHDIGKIGVPDAVLRKPAQLTDEEWSEMRRHPLHGQQILSGIEFLEGASRVVAQHHERFDGTGYPLGLRGEQIDLNARIFAVADAFDAVRSGANDYLAKPCDLDRLAMAIARAFERRSLLRAARYYRLEHERRNDELRRSKAELERLQSQIVQSEKMASLGQLAAGVAHELNNPAGFIYGNMEVLEECARGVERLLAFYESVPLADELDARAHQIKEAIDYEHTLADLRSIVADCREGAERIRDVVQNLRTFSRLDEAEFKKVDIHEGLESTLRLLSRHYNADRVRLTRDYGELPPVDCFAGQLNQVWLNLLVNAAHATREGGEVYIRTRREGEMAVVQISDDGHGIAPENLKRIFDPFFTTQPVGEGSGLGLSVTYSIVERHHGTITVESAPGLGTTFIVSIPIDAPRAAEEGDRCEA